MSKRPASPLESIPPPLEVHPRIGRLLRELAVLRRLLRLSRAAQAIDRPAGEHSGEEVARA